MMMETKSGGDPGNRPKERKKKGVKLKERKKRKWDDGVDLEVEKGKPKIKDILENQTGRWRCL
jgi:hypothetical protein